MTRQNGALHGPRDRRDAIERPRVPRILAEIGVGSEELVVAALVEGLVENVDQPIRLAIGQRPKQRPIDDAEDGCAELVRAKSPRKEPQTSNEGVAPSITGILRTTRFNSARFWLKSVSLGNRRGPSRQALDGGARIDGGARRDGHQASTSRLAFSGRLFVPRIPSR